MKQLDTKPLFLPTICCSRVRLAGYQGKRAWILDAEKAHRRISGDFNLDLAAASLDTLVRDQHLQVHGLLGQALIMR